MFKLTNSATQGVVNATLRVWGGAQGTLYIGAMSIINSLREVISQPISAVTSGAQPVIGFNYGARLYKRVRKSVCFMLLATLGYSLAVWAALMVPSSRMKVTSVG